MNLIVTGSSGYVSSFLIPKLMELDISSYIGIDLLPGEYTTHISNISDGNIWQALDKKLSYIIINLAAARFDFNVTADRYFELNVKSTKELITQLHGVNIEYLLHVSSVASFEGKYIDFSPNLGCDDAYRSTKYLQETLIKEFAFETKTPISILFPSAIYDDNPRSDTNIGTIQRLSRLLPFIPKIETKKSLTYLPSFCDFIIYSLEKRGTCEIMTIEKPILSVSQIMIANSGRLNRKLIRIPFFKAFLMGLSYLFLLFGKVLNVDPKLVPNRVIKLFSDTGFESLHKRYNLETYQKFREKR